MLAYDHLKEAVDEFVLDAAEELVDLVGGGVGDDDLEGLESAEEVVVVAHEAEAVQEGLDDVALLGKLDDVLAFEGQHDDELGDDVGQLGDAGLVELQEVVEDVHVDEDGVGPGLAGHVLGVFVADCVELAEEGGGRLAVGVEEDVLEEGAHEVQVVQAEPAGVGLLGQEEDYLPEVVADEALV